MIISNKSFFDFKSVLIFGPLKTFIQKGVAHASRTFDIFSGYGLHVDIRIPQMCGEISRQLQSTKFLMPRPIFVNGICSAYLSRKSPRHRGMPSLHGLKTLSYRHQRQHRQKYPGPTPTKTETGESMPTMLKY